MSIDSPIVYRDVIGSPFVITGFPWRETNRSWNRVPETIMDRLPQKLAWVAPQPSGGMIRFRSNSKTISLRVTLTRAEKSALVTPGALSGFCLYRGQGREKKFAGNLVPVEPLLEYESQVQLPIEDITEWTLYTPLQNPIGKIEVGLEAGAALAAPSAFSVPKPILFYGSSITCGFSASRPGLTYPARVCRSLDAELINFGFGGNARGEPLMAETIASLDLGCFVMDYDHNAPSEDHLRQTHQPFFEIIRKQRPDLPVVFVSSPNYHKAAYFEARRQIILETFEQARAAGDRQVWFVDGRDFFAADRWADCTVDGLHPNDAGFSRMAELILPAIRNALGQTEV